MTNPQCTLIVDSEEKTLAELPLRILRIGVDLDRIRAVGEALRSTASKVPRTLVAVGPKADEPTRARLREGGVELALWEPFDESALRFWRRPSPSSRRRGSPSKERSPTVNS